MVRTAAAVIASHATSYWPMNSVRTTVIVCASAVRVNTSGMRNAFQVVSSTTRNITLGLTARTGDLEFATKITDWIAATLIDPQTGLVRDGVRLNPDGTIDQAKMRAVSESTDFSFDFHDLLLKPAGKR